MNILELGEKLQNVSLACKNLGVSRQHFYDIKKAIEEDGIEGLLEKSRRTPRIRNRVPQEIEGLILILGSRINEMIAVRAKLEKSKNGF